MTTFYVDVNVTGIRVFYGDIQMSSKLAGGELSGNPFEPDHSHERRLPVGKYLPVSFDIDPNIF